MTEQPQMAVFVDRLPAADDRILKADAVMELLGLSRDAYYGLRHHPGFPRPVRITRVHVGFWRSEILAWIEQQRQPTLTGAFPITSSPEA